MGTLADLCASEIVEKELDKAYDDGYNNAIDEFAEALRVACLDSCYKEVGLHQMYRIAERLKKGGAI